MKRSRRSSGFVPRGNKGRNDRLLAAQRCGLGGLGVLLAGADVAAQDGRGARRRGWRRRGQPRARSPRKRLARLPRSKASTTLRSATFAQPFVSTPSSSPRISTWDASIRSTRTSIPDAARKALATYRALLDVAPSNAEALYQAGYLAACAGEWSSSRAWLERLPADARSRPQVLALLAIDFAALAEPRRASETATALLAHPDLTEADVLAAGPALDRANNAALEEQLLAGLDARGLASAASLRRLGAGGDAPWTPRGCACRARARGGRAHRHRACRFLLDLARVAYKQKDYEGVLGYLAHARELEPDNAEVHFFFGIAAIELNLGSEAYDALKKAVALSPDNPYVNYAMGAVAIHRHEPSEALPYFESVRPAETRRSARPLRARGGEVLQQRFRRRPRRPHACGARCRTPRRARIISSRASPVNRTNSTRRSWRSVARSRREPQYPDALAELGLLQTRRGEYAEAERSLTQALTLEPDNYAATVNLATLYARTRDPRREAQAARLAELQKSVQYAAQEFLRIVEIVK